MEYRTSRVCEQNVLEDEFHHVLFCDALIEPRTDFSGELNNVNYKDQVELLKTVFKLENLKISGHHIEAMFAIRREILYKSGMPEWEEVEEE